LSIIDGDKHLLGDFKFFGAAFTNNEDSNYTLFWAMDLANSGKATCTEIPSNGDEFRNNNPDMYNDLQQHKYSSEDIMLQKLISSIDSVTSEILDLG
jgi:hypothetical protein